MAAVILGQISAGCIEWRSVRVFLPANAHEKKKEVIKMNERDIKRHVDWAECQLERAVGATLRGTDAEGQPQPAGRGENLLTGSQQVMKVRLIFTKNDMISSF